MCLECFVIPRPTFYSDAFDGVISAAVCLCNYSVSMPGGIYHLYHSHLGFTRYYIPMPSGKDICIRQIPCGHGIRNYFFITISIMLCTKVTLGCIRYQTFQLQLSLQCIVVLGRTFYLWQR